MKVKIVFGMILMLCSWSVLASFQNQVSVGYIDGEIKGLDIDRFKVEYLYLFSPVQNEVVPYAEKIFIERPDQLKVAVQRNRLVDNLIPGAEIETVSDEYQLSGLYHLPSRPLYLAAGYAKSDYDQTIKKKNPSIFTGLLISPPDYLPDGSKSDTSFIQLGIYPSERSHVGFLYSKNEITEDQTGLELEINSSIRGLSYKQLFDVNSVFFSVRAAIIEQKTVFYSRVFGNLGLDDKSREAQLNLDYYVNKSTRVVVGIKVIKNLILAVNEDEFIRGNTLGIEHYFTPALFSSFAYINADVEDSDMYNLNIGYRF